MMGVDALLNEVEQRRKKALDALEGEYGANNGWRNAGLPWERV